jgi:putative transposon-encoded protein
MDIHLMRQVQIRKGDLNIKEQVNIIYEKQITRFGNSAKVDAPKKYIGKRAYIIIVDD